MFSGEDSAPYLHTTNLANTDLLHLPVIEQDDELRAKLAKIGLRRQIGMSRDGSVKFPINKHETATYTSWEVVKITPYTTALNLIGQAENKKDIPQGSYGVALELMLNDQFDDSGWAAQYMPKQQD